MLLHLHKDFLHHPAIEYRSQFIFEATLVEDEFLVIHPEQVQYGRMPVGHADFVLDGFDSQVRLSCRIRFPALRPRPPSRS